MDKKITSFYRDQEGEWVAKLECGHSQYVRHDPPKSVRPWMNDDDQRKQLIGTSINCIACESENEAQEISEEQLYKVAEFIKKECFKEAVDGYEFAKISGLCQEGAWDLAMDRVKSLNIKKVLKKLNL